MTQDAGSDGRYSVCCGNGYIPHLNGHIMGNPPPEKRVGNAETQEMECFTPMLNTFTNGSNERHLDTKVILRNKNYLFTTDLFP